MTITELIQTVATKPNFIKWAVVPTAIISESEGGIEKWNGKALVSTPDGRIVANLFFLVDTATGEATWQGNDLLEPEKNIDQQRTKNLSNYLKSNFFAYFLLKVDTNEFWAIAEVYTISGADLTKSTVLVYKPVGNPITHKKII